MPDLRKWIDRLAARLAARSPLPLAEGGLKPRFCRVCDVYGFSEVRVDM